MVKKKAEMVKKLHESVQKHIEKKNEHYATKANKGHRQVLFEPGDWVWVHMRKERFPSRRRSKLHPRGDGPFQVLERINDNAYKLNLPSEYNISATFNVSDLSPFDVGDDSRTNPFGKGSKLCEYRKMVESGRVPEKGRILASIEKLSWRVPKTGRICVSTE